MSGDTRLGILGGLAAYIIVYLSYMDAESSWQTFAIVSRWFLLAAIIFYTAYLYPKEEFRAHTRSPFKAAVLFWVSFFLLYSLKPGLDHLAIENGLQGVILFMLMHLIISFVLMLILTFAVRSWSNRK